MSIPSSPEPDQSPSQRVTVKWLHPSFTQVPVKWLYERDMAEGGKSVDVAAEERPQEEEPQDAKPQNEGDSSDEEIDVTEEITKQVSAGASYLGSMLSSAWTKTAKTANEMKSSAAASTLMSALGGPIKSVDDESEEVKAEDVKEAEEIPPLPKSSTQEFLSSAWSKVEGWTGDDAAGGGGGISSMFKAVASSATSAIRDSVGQLQAPSMLSEFNKEQDEFIREKEKSSIVDGVAPWVGYRDEDAVRAKILSLSADRRTFVRTPPSGVSFDFDYSSVSSTALALLDEDENLKRMRYELVPKAVKEDEFWRNYFYRVNLIKQSFDLDDFDEKQPSDREPVETRLAPEEDLNATRGGDNEDEFVSDSYQASGSQDNMAAEIDESMRRLGVGGKKGGGGGGGGDGGEEWEAELEGELNEFEMVSSKEDEGEDSPEWENQIQEMIDAEGAAK